MFRAETKANMKQVGTGSTSLRVIGKEIMKFQTLVFYLLNPLPIYKMPRLLVVASTWIAPIGARKMIVLGYLDCSSLVRQTTMLK